MVDKIWYNMEELIGGSEERVLIETYWNVNADKTGLRPAFCKVLIETYWNVNFGDNIQTPGGHKVLIETYWNVNIVFWSIYTCAFLSINRNILECKYYPGKRTAGSEQSINRNILECKFS